MASLQLMKPMELFKPVCVVNKIPGNAVPVESGKTGFICDTLGEYNRALIACSGKASKSACWLLHAYISYRNSIRASW